MKSILSLLLLLTTSAGMDSKVLCEGFLPPNDHKIFVGQNIVGNFRVGLDEQEFNDVLNALETIYKPIFTARGEVLKIQRLWSDPTVNAQAEARGKTKLVYMYGGLARNKHITPDAFAVVACHEIGHHIGGFPMMGQYTTEGQSDYYASLKCMRQYYEFLNKEIVIDEMQVPPVLLENCKLKFTEVVAQNICVKTALEAFNTVAMIADLTEEEVPDFNTPDPRQVRTSDSSHPQSQCRLDTFFQGSICEVPNTTIVDDRDYRIGTCNAPQSTTGIRPRCWFAPPTRP